jgi:hypothetical protein
MWRCLSELFVVSDEQCSRDQATRRKTCVVLYIDKKHGSLQFSLENGAVTKLH